MILNKRTSELIGAIIGDGCIRYKPEIHQYYIEIVGNKDNEQNYFKFLSNIFKEELGLNSFIKIRRGLRLKVYSKDFVEFLINDLKMPFNKDKCKNIMIPKQIFEDTILLKACIRGIMDTDGSLFFSNKGNNSDYPTIEISTISFNLANQLREMLSNKFRIGFREFKYPNSQKIYRISLNGNKMVGLWIDEIGFSNLRNLKKIKNIREGRYGNGGI